RARPVLIGEPDVTAGGCRSSHDRRRHRQSHERQPRARRRRGLFLPLFTAAADEAGNDHHLRSSMKRITLSLVCAAALFSACRDKELDRELAATPVRTEVAKRAEFAPPLALIGI